MASAATQEPIALFDLVEKVLMKYMMLPTQTMPPKKTRVGSNGGGVSTCGGNVAALDPKVEFMDFCSKCLAPMHFVAGWQCESGLLGVCLGCGDERVIPFSRAVSEVA